MIISKAKWLSLTVSICFAILQALQPFIHAHLDAEHPIQKTGFHVGDEHEEVLNVEHLANYASNVSHASHTISVDSSIKQDTDSMLFINAIFAVAFSICFILVLQSTHRLNPAFLLVPKESLKRRLPASRAPPKF
jgi:phosphoglycerol transferase MdoB-like AlkP superfamily enzyme